MLHAQMVSSSMSLLKYASAKVTTRVKTSTFPEHLPEVALTRMPGVSKLSTMELVLTRIT
jgi:hypothetical protein